VKCDLTNDHCFHITDTVGERYCCACTAKIKIGQMVVAPKVPDNKIGTSKILWIDRYSDLVGRTLEIKNILGPTEPGCGGFAVFQLASGDKHYYMDQRWVELATQKTAPAVTCVCDSKTLMAKGCACGYVQKQKAAGQRW
jgi:hypothetical protein